MRFASLVVVAIVAYTAADASAADAQSRVVESNVVLHPGDSLAIAVWRNPELSGGFTLGANGNVRHPLYQEVQLAGLPIEVVNQRIAEFLRRFVESPQFLLEPYLRVIVEGEVVRPSLYTFSPEVSVAEAVILAGGASPQGRVDRVRLIRGGEQYDLTFSGPIAEAIQTPIRSGDRIVVLRRADLLRSYVLPTMTAVGSVSSLVALISLLRS